MASNVSFTVTNAATASSGASTAVMYDNVPATLTFVVTNLTGSDVTLPVGDQPFALMCPRCFTSQELQAAQFAAPSGMSFQFDGMVGFDMSVGSTDIVWASGEGLTFTLSSLETTGPDNTYFFSLQLLGPNLPRQVTANLAVQAAPVAQNADLSTVLDLTFQPNGVDSVYVSTIQPYLVNTLWINFNNSSNQPIYSGTTNPTGNPQVIVSFTYGTDAGSLAPMQVANQIKPGISSSEGNAWGISMDTDNDGLTWVLTPQTPDPIGTGSNANITFSFENIVVPTAGGNMTQMLLQFLNFWQSDTVAYNPWLVFLNIDKLVTPPQRGLVNFQSTTTETGVTSPSDLANIEFTWEMNFVASVQLSYVLIETPVTLPKQTYGQQTAAASDSKTFPIYGFQTDTTVVFTLASFDENGDALNSLQFRIVVQANFFFDPRDNTVYLATQIGELLWMNQNLAWVSPGSVPVNGDPTNTPNYGLLYPYSDASAVPETSDDWRLASQDDYTPLSSLSYAQLTSSGPGLPNLQQGGYAFSTGFGGFGSGCVYWTSTTDDSESYPQAYTFNATPTGTELALLPTGIATPVVGLAYLAVRYVRNVPTAAQIAQLREG
jgi:hypothetical protein